MTYEEQLADLRMEIAKKVKQAVMNNQPDDATKWAQLFAML